jgi:hypothetical protein
MMLGRAIGLAVLLIILVVCSFACAGPEATPTPAPTPTPLVIPPSTITSVDGQVFVLEPGAASWVEATEGMNLEVGDSLKTGVGGYCVIVFFEGSVMEVYEHTRISVVDLSMTEAGSTTISLTQEIGNTVNRVEQLVDPASSYEVETPAGVAVVRGTWYNLGVRRNGFTTLSVKEGEACFEAQGKIECATGGFYIITIPGNPPFKAQSSAPPESQPPSIGAFPIIPIYPLPSVTGIRIELTWNTNGTDLDSHFIAPDHLMWDPLYDCHTANKNPDWDGIGGSGTAGDPLLDVDDTDGLGPENITLVQPPFNGFYGYKVHYQNHDECVEPTEATVKIWINDVQVAIYNHTFDCLEGYDESGLRGTTADPSIWDCACIEWPSGNVTPGACPEPTPMPTP